jgi:hypothetical protein
LSTETQDEESALARGASAVKHEVRHLILRTNEHGEAGLMSAIWTEQKWLGTGRAASR